MIQLYSDDLCVLGLTQGNLDRLKEGKPLKWTPMKQSRTVLIVFGTDKPAILAELEKAGMTFPDAIRQSAIDDPA